MAPSTGTILKLAKRAKFKLNRRENNIPYRTKAIRIPETSWNPKDRDYLIGKQETLFRIVTQHRRRWVPILPQVHVNVTPDGDPVKVKTRGKMGAKCSVRQPGK